MQAETARLKAATALLRGAWPSALISCLRQQGHSDAKGGSKKKIIENLARMQAEKTVAGKVCLTERTSIGEPWDEFFFLATYEGRLAARQAFDCLAVSKNELHTLADIGSIFAEVLATGGASKIREIADAFEAWDECPKEPDLFRQVLLMAYSRAGGSDDGKKLVTLKPGQLREYFKTLNYAVTENTMSRVRKVRDELGINLRFARGRPEPPKANNKSA